MSNILRSVTQKVEIIAEAINLKADPEAVAWLTAQHALPAILETCQRTKTAGQISIFAADPLRIVSCGPGGEYPIAKFVREAKATLGGSLPPCDIPFAAGWIGHVAYEAGVPAGLVNNRSDHPEIPVLQFGLYDHALVFDHRNDRWWATAAEWPDAAPKRARACERMSLLRRRLENARSLKLPDVPDKKTSLATTAMTESQFQAKVRRIKEYVEAGDIYQANLAQRFHVVTEYDPFEVYRRLRQMNPAPFAAYLSRTDHAIVSASPELFLSLRDGHATTRPIKGTCPRSGIDSVDGFRSEELCGSEKDVAELNMIIDLLRNDFGRVCEFGSVRVVEAGTLEAHPTVFHRVATIDGRLAPGNDWSNLLEATFPCGSIVGAPKIRAMQIIRELEPFPRGPYCGAIGWIGLDGNMTFNVAIRTMVCRRGTVDVYAGAGIVAQSDPKAEYEEVLAKAGGLLSSLGVQAKGRHGVKKAALATNE